MMDRSKDSFAMSSFDDEAGPDAFLVGKITPRMNIMLLRTSAFLRTAVLLSLTLLFVSTALCRADSSPTMVHRPLVEAAAEGDIKKVALLLREGAEANSTDHKGMTALMAAARNGRTDVVKLLLQEGADVDATDRDGATALHKAAFFGHPETVRVLLAGGAGMDREDNKGYTPLMWAAFWGHNDVIRLMKSHGADITIHDAARMGDLSEMQRLLRANNDVDRRNERGRTALMLAAEQGFPGLVEILLQRGADPELRTPKGALTALMLAAWKGNTGVIRLLIESGSDVNARGKDGWTALMLAASEGKPEAVQLLIDGGAQVNAVHNEGWSPLLFAAHAGHVETAKILLAAGAAPNLGDIEGYTPMSAAVTNGYREIVGLLKKYGTEFTDEVREEAVAESSTVEEDRNRMGRIPSSRSEAEPAQRVR